MRVARTASDIPTGRACVEGRFLQLHGDRLWVRGVTYGTFAESPDGHPYPSRARVEDDFAAIVACGANAVRVYTPPPRWLLDVALERGLGVMVGAAWEQHVAFLESRAGARRIADRVRKQVASVAGHPALLCLAVGNEIPAPIVRWHGAGRIERFIERLVDAARDEDPGALVTYVNYPSTEYLDLPFLDLVSFNVFLDSSERFEAYVARLHNLAEERPLLITEIGLDSRTHGLQAQAELVERQARAVFADGCAGGFVFSWTDEWHRGGAAVTDWAFGVTDAERRPKPSLWALRHAFTDVAGATTSDVLPSVSVVVCTHNGAVTIAECLEGIAALDYPNVETIVVDDGSTDETAEIVAGYDVQLVSTRHAGLSAARNAGLAAASGEIVAFTDDDAVPDRHWLRFLVERLLDGEHAGVGGPNLAPPIQGRIAAAVARAPGGPTHVLLSDRVAEHIPGCNMAFWRSSLDAVGGFDPRFRVAGDDVDICWRLQDRGWTLGFSPSAVVWHRRRSTFRAYLRQQREYGRAEALLERKWPQKYNGGGHLAWAGRVYASVTGTRRSRPRRRIHYGSWGENLYQSVYDRGPSTPGLLPLMPEWYLLIALFVALSAYEVSRGPLVSIPWLGVSPALVLLGTSLVALLVQALRAALASTRDLGARMRGRVVLTTLVAGLFVAQPLARLSGRVRHGLTPWRRRGALRAHPPWTRRVAVWSETWASARERLLALEAHLQPNCMTALRGGEYDRWDIHVRLGPLAAARMRMTIEEHGHGRQLLRFKIWPRWSVGLAVLLAFSTAGTAVAVVGGDAVSAAVLGLTAAVLSFRAAEECGASIAAINDAIGALPDPPPVELPSGAGEQPYITDTDRQAEPAMDRVGADA